MRLLLCFLLLSSSFLCNAFEPSTLLRGADSESKSLIKIISQFPKAQELIRKATEKGPITVKFSRNHTMPFEAKWESGTREITLDGLMPLSKGNKIRDILFELHNALSTKEDGRLIKLAMEGRISCDQYVRGVEEIEHQNVLKTAELVDLGIKMHFLPEETHWDVIRNFNIHYQIQQLNGHSDIIVEEYRSMCRKNALACPYKGTIRKSPYSQENERRATELYWQYMNS